MSRLWGTYGAFGSLLQVQRVRRDDRLRLMTGEGDAARVASPFCWRVLLERW